MLTVNKKIIPSEILKCLECGSNYFISAFVLIKVSKIQYPQLELGPHALPTFCCKDCGHINKGLNPVEQFDTIPKNKASQERLVKEIIT